MVFLYLQNGSILHNNIIQVAVMKETILPLSRWNFLSISVSVCENVPFFFFSSFVVFTFKLAKVTISLWVMRFLLSALTLT